MREELHGASQAGEAGADHDNSSWGHGDFLGDCRFYERRRKFRVAQLGFNGVPSLYRGDHTIRCCTTRSAHLACVDPAIG